MDRRALLMATLAAIGGILTGCLEKIGDSNESGDTDDKNDTEMNNHKTDDNDMNTDNTPDSGMDTPSDDTSNDTDDRADQDGNHEEVSICETRFEVLDSDVNYEIAASVTFETDSVTVSGTIVGNNSCYTAKLGEVRIENQLLLVNVESYEDADENEGCMEAEYGIDYEAVIEFDGEIPTAVTVKYNGEEITTERSP